MTEIQLHLKRELTCGTIDKARDTLYLKAQSFMATSFRGSYETFRLIFSKYGLNSDIEDARYFTVIVAVRF